MFVIGLLLLAAAVAVGAAGIAANTGSEHSIPGGFVFFGYHLHGSSGRLLVLGIVIGAVGMLGLMMAADGLRRSAALRRELVGLRRDARARRRAEESAKSRPEPATAPATAAQTTDAPARRNVFARLSRNSDESATTTTTTTTTPRTSRRVAPSDGKTPSSAV